jgi:hypothetical protein
LDLIVDALGYRQRDMNMPAFRSVLSESEVIALIDKLTRTESHSKQPKRGVLRHRTDL